MAVQPLSAEAGGSSQGKRIGSPRTATTVSSEAGPSGSLVETEADVSPMVIGSLVNQATEAPPQPVTVDTSSRVTEVPAVDHVSQPEEQTETAAPSGNNDSGSTAASTAPKSKKVTQPKVVKRRGAARLSNQDLILEVMGQNSGVTKPSIRAPVAQQTPEQDEIQPSTSHGQSESGELPAPQVEDAEEALEDAPEPTRAPKRAPNVAEANRRRQQAATSTQTGQTVVDQQEEVQADASDVVGGVENVQKANGAPRAAKPKKPRQPRPKKRPAAESQGAGEESNGNAPKPKRTRRKPKTPARVNDDDAENETPDSETLEAAAEVEEGAVSRKRHRSLSEHLIFDEEDRENPEKTKINAISMPMGVLIQDIPLVGTTSTREEALSKINWDEEKRKRMEERERIALGEEVAQTQAERDAALARLQEAANASSTTVQAPQTRVVNGRLVLDTISTQLDRNARAREDAEELQEIEEDELTTRVNQMSWIKANRKDPRERTTWGPTRADRWSDEQTEMFYDALKMFGTDFFIISKMFPGKTRANVKRKFVKEERLDPDRVKRVLIGESVPMDFEEYKRKTGKDDEFFKDPEQLRRELAQETEQQQHEVEEAQAKYAEQQRQRKLAKAGGAEVEGEEDEGAAGKKGKKKKGEGRKSKKSKAPVGGEEIEVVAFDGDELEHRR